MIYSAFDVRQNPAYVKKKQKKEGIKIKEDLKVENKANCSSNCDNLQTKSGGCKPKLTQTKLSQA